MDANPLALIIEDDEDLATIFAEALKAADFQVEVVRDGAIARQRLKLTTPKVVVLDMHLPHVAGTDLLAQIRTDERLRGTHVIVTTADARMGEATRDVADFVLIKPITFTQLREISNRLRNAPARG